MHWKYTANAAFFGARKSKYYQFQPPKTLGEKVELVSKLEAVKGVELKYPMDFEDPAETRKIIEGSGLKLSAVNVNIKDVEHFRHGALSSSSPDARRRVVDMLKSGMDIAAEFGAGLATTCPLADGYDYPFQIDHFAAWGHFVDSVREAASHRADVKLALEYQPHEPHARVMLSDAGKVLYVCNEVDLPNLGCNLDVGHSFAAGESPAEAACLLAGSNRLFYIHSNDNTANGGDWDMISGSIHLWEWMELLHTLRRVGYDGWIGADLEPKHDGPVEIFRANFMMIERMTDALDSLDAPQLEKLVETQGGIAATFELLLTTLTRGK